jgi:IG-like fold at C-terminal of FixG, putative oxidoreductase
VTNNHVDSTGSEKFRIEVEGLPEGADVRSIEVEIAPEQTVTVPLIVRLPPDSKVPRTLPIEVKVIGATDEVELDTTFKSEQAL